jgi:2-methylisocitrate lyase-like PEP mutase family enzyme
MSGSARPSPGPVESARLAADAERLRGLHRPGSPLILPNAWDAASARVVADAGFPVVATTSSGVANSLGWADGQHTPPDEMFAAVWRIARAVTVPVSADVEAGYGLPPEDLVDRLLAAGAAGCNLEDTDHAAPGRLVDAEPQADFLARVKRAARAAGVDLVLNARVDVFLRKVGPAEERLEHALRRARLYLLAGADCIFPFGVADEATIRALVEGIDAPVNVAVRAYGPPVARLRELGVARISFAGQLARLALADHQRRVADIRDDTPQEP